VASEIRFTPLVDNLNGLAKQPLPHCQSGTFFPIGAQGE